jgi:thiopurine S-methyltransferase
MTSEDIAGVSAIFDRASLIALPSSMCSANAAHMQTILASGVNTLFVTYFFLQHEMQGPPFSVKKPEERGGYEKTGEVRLLFSADISDQELRFGDRDVTQLQDKILLVPYNAR